MSNSEQIDNMIHEMKMHQVDKIGHFQYSRIASIPFKVHSFIEIMNLRMIDFSESAQILLKNDKVVPAASLIRSLFENAAITNRIAIAVEESLKNKKLTDDFDNLITRIKFGTRYDDEIVSINVLTQIDKLDKQFNGFRKFYDSLCEYTHPNWDGVEGSYSELDEKNRCTHLSKIITTEHAMTEYFKSCFLFVIIIFSGSAEWVRNKLQSFTELCESEINLNG